MTERERNEKREKERSRRIVEEPDLSPIIEFSTAPRLPPRLLFCRLILSRRVFFLLREKRKRKERKRGEGKRNNRSRSSHPPGARKNGRGGESVKSPAQCLRTAPLPRPFPLFPLFLRRRTSHPFLHFPCFHPIEEERKVLSRTEEIGGVSTVLSSAGDAFPPRALATHRRIVNWIRQPPLFHRREPEHNSVPLYSRSRSFCFFLPLRRSYPPFFFCSLSSVVFPPPLSKFRVASKMFHSRWECTYNSRNLAHYTCFVGIRPSLAFEFSEATLKWNCSKFDLTRQFASVLRSKERAHYRVVLSQVSFQRGIFVPGHRLSRISVGFLGWWCGYERR